MNPTEIRMFVKATEIQEQWEIHAHDRMFVTDYADRTGCFVHLYMLEKDGIANIRKWGRWIPYPHQYVLSGYDNSVSGIARLLHEFLSPEDVCPEEDCCIGCQMLGKYRRKTFLSIDTAMLGMVMDWCYDKYWWNGDWHLRK